MKHSKEKGSVNLASADSLNHQFEKGRVLFFRKENLEIVKQGEKVQTSDGRLLILISQEGAQFEQCRPCVGLCICMT